MNDKPKSMIEALIKHVNENLTDETKQYIIDQSYKTIYYGVYHKHQEQPVSVYEEEITALRQCIYLMRLNKSHEFQVYECKKRKGSSEYDRT